jgi:hypothetical protein
MGVFMKSIVKITRNVKGKLILGSPLDYIFQIWQN